MGSSDLGNYQLVRIIFIKVVSILLWPCKFNFFLRSWSSKFTDSVFFHFFGKQWYSYTIGGKKDSSKRYLWSKTTLITGGVGRTGADPLSWKTDTFFRSLALSVPIYRNFQSNGGKWRSLKLWTKKLWYTQL